VAAVPFTVDFEEALLSFRVPLLFPLLLLWLFVELITQADERSAWLRIRS
jgi:hypothetical protein